MKDPCVSRVSHRYMRWLACFRLREGSRQKTKPRRICGFPGLELGTLLEIRVTTLIATPGARPKACHIGLDVSVELAATDVADLQLLEDPEELLIEKAAIQPNDDRRLPMVVFANRLDDVPDHLLGRVGLVGMPVAGAKDGIDDEPPSCHSEPLEPLDLLLGGLDAMALCRLTVVHDHDIDAKDHNGRILFLQPPRKSREAGQQQVKQVNPRPPEPPEKPLHRMGGEHHPGFALNRPRVSFILPDGIEKDQCRLAPSTKKSRQRRDLKISPIGLAIAEKMIGEHPGDHWGNATRNDEGTDHVGQLSTKLAWRELYSIRTPSLFARYIFSVMAVRRNSRSLWGTSRNCRPIPRRVLLSSTARISDHATRALARI